MESIFLPLLREPARHVFRLLFRPRYRTLCRLNTFYGRSKRYQKKVIRIGSWKIETPDVASFISAYREIFLNEIYSFPSTTTDPVIVDCGSNIGLSIFYFKSLHPKCRILAYEADPNIFTILKKNIESNGISGVELVQKAVWSSNTELTFSQEGADGGRLNTGNDDRLIKVKTVRLSEVLEDMPAIDFLKMDIEGAENSVIEDCSHLLQKIPFIFVEFHSFTDRNPQGLGKMLSQLEASGFRTHLHAAYSSMRPFQGVQAISGMDLQMNCFFTRLQNA